MSEYTHEDFEKIERIQEQDENVTSTSMSDDIAEQFDRYEESGDNDAQDIINDFRQDDTNESSGGEPLISFGVTETTAKHTTPAGVHDLLVDEVARKADPVCCSEGCFMKSVDPRVLDLIYWRDVKTTGVVFGCMMFVLLSLACFSLLSVVAYLSLAILTVTFSFRVYKNVMQAVQKTNEGNPFKKWLDFDLELKEDIVKSAAEKIAANINNCSRELRRLYLVVDYIDSLKFGLLLWLLTYVGSWFNGMTLIILALVFIFTLPKVYETYQGPIDQNINLVRAQLNKIMAQVSEKIPFPKKKAKAQ